LAEESRLSSLFHDRRVSESPLLRSERSDLPVNYSLCNACENLTAALVQKILELNLDVFRSKDS
jgi:hypothetical protein